MESNKPFYKDILIVILLIFIIGDLIYSGFQYYHRPIGGDMPSIIIPKAGGIDEGVFKDPLGINAIINGANYSNPNRFFAHYTTSKYYLYVPGFLQNFVSPITSVYLAVALANLLMQIIIIYFIAVYATGTYKILDKNFLIAAALATTFFQTNGFWGQFGIVDPSVIYAFFYGLPLALTLMYFSPVFLKLHHGNSLKLNIVKTIFYIGFTILITLNGPLIPGVILVATSLVFLKHFIKSWKEKEFEFKLSTIWNSVFSLPKPVIFVLVFSSLMSLYSLYVSSMNSQNGFADVSLLDRFQRLPVGLWQLLSVKYGLPFLIVGIFLNIFIIYSTPNSISRKKVMSLGTWILAFVILYTLLLPFGGYRPWRPNIIRYDSEMPAILSLIFFYLVSALFIFKNAAGIRKKIAIIFIAFFAIFLQLADKYEISHWQYEKESLEILATSTENPVFIDTECNIMNWNKVTDPAASEHNAELFHIWKITQEKKLYFQK